MPVTVNVPASSGGAPVTIVLPSGSSSSDPSITIPTSEGPPGPPGTRSTDIGFSWPGEVPEFVGTFPVTKETTITGSLCLAEATGTGVVSFDLDGEPIGSVAFPGAVFTISNPVIDRGFLNFTSTGALVDLSLALSGIR